MIKKAFKIAITFAALTGVYLGYVRIFAIVAQRATIGRGTITPLLPTTSKTLKEAISLAERAFGPDHWTANHDLQIRYYDKFRGYWMYAQKYERMPDGKRLRFTPFALIWQVREKDKLDLRTVISNEAIVDLDRPLGLASKPNAEPMRIIHAQINGEVNLRDDRGTEDRKDDLTIGPLPYLEYDEPTLQVRSHDDAEVVIQDPKMWIKGYGLFIQLRPREETDPNYQPGHRAATPAPGAPSQVGSTAPSL